MSIIRAAGRQSLSSTRRVDMAVLEGKVCKAYGRGCATSSAASPVYSGAELPESYPLQTAPGTPDLAPHGRLTDAKVLDAAVTVVLRIGIRSTSASSAPTMAACREVSTTSTSTTPLRPDSTRTSFKKPPSRGRKNGPSTFLGIVCPPRAPRSRRAGKTVGRQPADAPNSGSSGAGHS